MAGLTPEIGLYHDADVTMKVIRNGKPRQLTVHLGSDAQLQTVKATAKRKGGSGVQTDLGFTMAEYSLGLAQEFGLPRFSDPRPCVAADSASRGVPASIP